MIYHRTNTCIFFLLASSSLFYFSLGERDFDYEHSRFHPSEENSKPKGHFEEKGPSTSNSEKLVSIQIKYSSIYPNEETTIRIFGKRMNLSSSFGQETRGFGQFQGIPFGVAPTKNLRFQRPQMKILNQSFKATESGPPCPQISSNGKIIGDENCLFLNVYVPLSGKKGEGLSNLPVLVWFPGESLDSINEGIFRVMSTGLISDLQPEVFLSKKIIVVTPQFRLGSLGFLSANNEELSGNMGLYDQILALEWVQKFIPFFGGDRNQVTVMGHGSSAMTLGLLSTSELSKGLIHRIIMMGGSPVSPTAIDRTPKTTFGEVAVKNSCPTFPVQRAIRCLQKQTVGNIVLSDYQLYKENQIGKSQMANCVIQKTPDNRFLPPVVSSDPLVAISEGNFLQVPLIVGITSSEMSGFISSLSALNENEVAMNILSSSKGLKNFIRKMMSLSESASPDLLTELVNFDYFAGLNATEREEQAFDSLERVVSDFLFNIPAVSMAKKWSRYAPVYFYVYDYISPLNAEYEDDQPQLVKPSYNGHLKYEESSLHEPSDSSSSNDSNERNEKDLEYSGSIPKRPHEDRYSQSISQGSKVLQVPKRNEENSPISSRVPKGQENTSRKLEDRVNTKGRRLKRKPNDKIGFGAYQTSHGKDLEFLMNGFKSSSGEDRLISDIMVDFWINFIHKGSPLHSGYEWPRYREGSDNYILFDNRIQQLKGFKAREEVLWTQIGPEIGKRSCERRRLDDFPITTLAIDSGPDEYIGFSKRRNTYRNSKRPMRRNQSEINETRTTDVIAPVIYKNEAEYMASFNLQRKYNEND